jgi:hypothetical protein
VLDVLSAEVILLLLFINFEQIELVHAVKHFTDVVFYIDVIYLQLFGGLFDMIDFVHLLLFVDDVVAVKKDNYALSKQSNTSYFRLYTRSSLAKFDGMPAIKGTGASSIFSKLKGSSGRITCSHLNGYRKDTRDSMTYPTAT